MPTGGWSAEGCGWGWGHPHCRGGRCLAADGAALLLCLLFPRDELQLLLQGAVGLVIPEQVCQDVLVIQPSHQLVANDLLTVVCLVVAATGTACHGEVTLPGHALEGGEEVVNPGPRRLDCLPHQYAVDELALHLHSQLLRAGNQVQVQVLAKNWSQVC